MAEKRAKKCRECGKVQPLANFPVEKRNRDGRTGSCRECRNASRRKDSGEVAASGPAKPSHLPPSDPKNPARWWLETLEAAQRKLFRHPNDRGIQQWAGTVARVASAAKAFVDQRELEEEMAQIRATEKARAEAMSRGTRVTAPAARGLPPEQRSSDSVH